jgi:mono/diheme cytochrome c family protein
MPRANRERTGRRLILALLVLSPLAAGCRQDMHDQPRYKPLAESDFFGDGRSARPLVEGTVARGQLRDDPHIYTGKLGEGFAETIPYPVDAAFVARGRERFDIFCSPCHGRTGRGDGMVVRRGYRQAQSFHSDRLRQERLGYFFDVITNGFGAMPDYREQIPVKDRWAIVGYVRALQLSQHASLEDVPEAARTELERDRPTP